MPAAAGSHPGGGEGRRPLVGRDRHLRELRLLLDALGRGRGNLLLLAGDAGIGKTRLAEEAVALASDEGVRAARVTCWAEAGAPPFWPWAELLRTVLERPAELADLPDRPSPTRDRELARFRLFDGVWRDLQTAARERPWVLVIDDLHWADTPSIRLLTFVAPLLHDVPLLVLATYRDTDVEAETTLGAALPELVRHGRQLVLQALTRAEVAEVVAALTGADAPDDAAARLHWLTAGNPLFVRELVHLVAPEGSGWQPGLALPDSVRATIAQRLDAVSDACRRVLEVASVVGVEFGLDGLREVVGLDDDALLDALDEAGRVRLLREVHVGRWMFVHPLTREATYHELGLARRVRLHREVGAALERLRGRGREVDAAELAHHFRNAAPGGTADQAVAYAWEAARRAMTMLAYETAVSHLEHALSMLGLCAPDPARRMELLLDLGDARVATGDLPRARDAFEDAARLAREHDAAEHLARAALGLGSGPTGFEVAMFDRAQIVLLEEAAVALGFEPSAWRVWVLARLSVAGSLGGTDADQLERAEQAVEMGRRVGDPAALAYALAAHCDAIAGPEHSERRLDEASEIVALAHGLGDTRVELLGRRLRLVALLETGAISEVDAEIGLYARAAAAIRQPLYEWYVPLWRGMRALMEGRVDAADGWREEAARIGVASHSDNAEMLTVTLQLWTLAQRGRGDEACTITDRLMARWPELAPMMGPSVAIARLSAGRVDDARTVLDAVRLDELTPALLGSEWLPCIALLGEVAGRIGGHPLALALYETLLPFRHRFAIDGIGAHLVCSVEHPLAWLARALGRDDDAHAHFGAAIEAYRRTGATFLLERAVHDAGTLAPAPSGPGRAGEFRREGDVWVLGYDGRVVRLRHTKGLADLACLLAQPGNEVHVLDLVETGGTSAEADTGERVDRTARESYKHRLVEIEADLDAADADGDTARSARLHAERDAIVAELAAAYGLGGRARRAGGSAERARSTVTQRLRDALARIDAAHPELGRHLRRSVRTGSFCSYEPDGPVAWDLGSRA